MPKAIRGGVTVRQLLLTRSHPHPARWRGPTSPLQGEVFASCDGNAISLFSLGRGAKLQRFHGACAHPFDPRLYLLGRSSAMFTIAGERPFGTMTRALAS